MAEKDTGIGFNPGDEDLAGISFADEESQEEEQATDMFSAESFGVEEEDAGDTYSSHDEWEEAAEARAPVPAKTPFYRKPLFFVVLIVVLALAGGLIWSKSKQARRKAPAFDQQFAAPAMPAPAAPAQLPQPGIDPGVSGQQFGQPTPAVPGGVNDTPPAGQAAPVLPPGQPQTKAPGLPSSGFTTAPPSPAGNGQALPVAQNAPPQPAAPVTTPIGVGATGVGPGKSDIEAIERRMREELLALSGRIDDLKRENRALSAKVERLSKKPASKEVRPVAQIEAPAAAPAPKPQPETFSIKAIRKGQAWLVSSTGAAYTVNVGDMLPGNIRVTGIDPDNLEVTTSSGVIRYRKQ